MQETVDLMGFMNGDVSMWCYFRT